MSKSTERKLGGSIYSDGSYLADNATWHSEDSQWKAGNILAMIQAHDVAPQSVAEIGCGAGEILRHLQQQMPASVRFSGYDISPQAIAICDGKANSRLSFHLEDLAQSSAHAPGAFDLLLCIDIFEHVEDSFGFLRAIKKLATFKVFHIPLALSMLAVGRKSPLIESRRKVGHIHYYNKDLALALLQDTGHEIVDWSYTSAALDLAPKYVRTYLARLPRRLLSRLSPDLAARVFGGFSLLVLAK